jgi:hypothetical protein
MILEHSRVKKLVDQFFQGGVYGVQALNVGPAGKTIGDLVEVFYLHRRIPVLFRIQNNIRSFLAGSEAHVRFDFHISEPFGLNSLLKFGHELLGAPILTVYVLTDETNCFHRLLLDGM